MERAKKDHSGFEFYRQELSVHTRERLSLEEDLRWASERGHFVLHYQPILALATGQVVGAEALARGQLIGVEALARWPHFERGMMPPSEFIPLAEQTGRIISLDRWAISAAARQAALWCESGWAGWVSVNLSARSLHDPELPVYVARVLEAQKLDPARLVLEVTESAAMRDPDATARVLRALKDVGAIVAVDDFGVGHSSLAYLKYFPVDLLKLDQSFVQDIGIDAKDEQLLEVMITLAHRIGAQVVAEGVEEEGQLEWLRASGCDFVQGYLIGQPVPAEDVQPGVRP
jgi:EAL domain-containing protein (putative c-di-GMP-specific phosphodiesterase class I)